MRGLRTLVQDVADLEQATRFYTALLEQPPYFVQPFYVGFDVGGYEVGLRPAEGAQQPGAGGSTAYLHVDDVDATIARAISLGARAREAATDVGAGIRLGSVVDPSGNLLGFIRNLEFAPRWVAAGADDLSPRQLRHETTVPLARDRVWAAWTSSEGVKQWIVRDARIELRPGGAYEWYFLLDNRPGLRGGEGCRVLSFSPERMLSFTWNAPPELAKTRDQHTWVVVEFADAAPGHTRVTLTHLGWPARGLVEEPQWEETARYFERAWGVVMRELSAWAERSR